jgi:2-haloacid dehalogenase
LLASLQEVGPWSDAGECLHALRVDGHRLVAVTDDSRDSTRLLLERTGLWKWFERILSAEAARACRPCHRMYEHLFRTVLAGPYECCLVSAHGWDVLGAEALGMHSVYVSRLEQQWPFPGNPSGFVVSSLSEVPEAISRAFGKPAEAQESPAEGSLKGYGEA